MANGTALSIEELKKLGQGFASAQTDIKATGSIQPMATAQPNSPVKTDTNYVPLIGPNKDPNGGNLTEYRAPLATDNPQMLQAQAQAPAATTPVTATPMPVVQATPAPDYAALSKARTAAALANKRTIAEQQKGSLDRSFQRSNQITQDNRAIENGRIDRTLSPYTGKTSYDKALIGRERTLADESSTNNLNAQKANIDQLLADYENATYDEQIRIADELQRADRAYNLSLAEFNQNQSNADRNFNQNQQVIDYNQDPNNPTNIGQGLQNTGQAQQNLLNQYKIDSYPEEQKAAATKVQQELALGKMDVATAEYNFKQLKDPNSTYNQAAAIDLKLKQLDLKNAPEKDRLEIQQLQKQIAQIGVVHYKPQTPKEAEMEQLQIDTAKKQLELLGSKTPAVVINPKDSADAYSSIIQDLNDASDINEANALIEANKSYLTDADYKAAKKAAIDKF